MRIGRDVFVGLSTRTNPAGVSQLRNYLEPFGYRIIPVAVSGCLHLKSACCPMGDGRILVNAGWLDDSALKGYDLIHVPAAEPGAANILRIGNSVLMPCGYPQTAEILQGFGLDVRAIDISELMKAEAAVTCSSVLFESP